MELDKSAYISIITVTKNNRKGLESTYHSLRSQRLELRALESIEWVIVDGASCDDTLKFISSMNININTTFISEADNGIFDAMNKSVSIAKGNHILFLNAGDTLTGSSTLAQLVELSTKNPNQIIAGKVKMHWKNHIYITNLSPWVCHQSVLTPKTILEDYPFDQNKKFFGDLHLWMRLQRDGLFNVLRAELIVSNFELGGVGNNPAMSWLRIKERRLISHELSHNFNYLSSFILTFTLNLIWRIFGENVYYNALIFTAKVKDRIRSKKNL